MLHWEDLKRSSCRALHFAPNGEVEGLSDKLAKQGVAVLELAGDRIDSERGLLAALAETLRFPEYFGMNWDATDECLRDMEWIRAKGYVLLVRGARELWQRCPEAAGSLVTSWLFAADQWNQDAVPFHLVFVW
jgi:hypothetical protein